MFALTIMQWRFFGYIKYADYCDRWSQHLSVYQSRGQAVRERLNGSTSCLGCRLLGTQETLCYQSAPHWGGGSDAGCDHLLTIKFMLEIATWFCVLRIYFILHLVYFMPQLLDMRRRHCIVTSAVWSCLELWYNENMFHSVLFFNQPWWYKVWLHCGWSSPVVYSPSLPWLLPPMIALSMSWCVLPSCLWSSSYSCFWHGITYLRQLLSPNAGFRMMWPKNFYLHSRLFKSDTWEW